MPRFPGLVFVALAITLLVAVTADRAVANHVQCGDVITQDTTLDSDLIDCPGDGIVIGADDIALDLGGHTVDGDGGGLCCDSGIRNDPSGTAPSDRGHDGVTIRNGLIREFDCGASFAAADRNVLRRLTVSANRLFGIASGGSRNSIIEGNVASGNNYGIHLSEVTNDRVVRNLSLNNEVDGIHLDTSQGNQLLQNTVLGNGEDGIDVSDGVRFNRIGKNFAAHNGHTGIWLYEGPHQNLIESNAVVGNGFERVDDFSGGIVVSSGTGNRLENNRAAGNGGGGGIALTEGAESVIVQNVVSENESDGVWIAGDAKAVVGRNVANRNGDDGIDTDSPETTLERNRANRNQDLGVEAVTGVVDGRGNRAFANGNPLQCLNLVCR